MQVQVTLLLLLRPRLRVLPVAPAAGMGAHDIDYCTETCGDRGLALCHHQQGKEDFPPHDDIPPFQMALHWLLGAPCNVLLLQTLAVVGSSTLAYFIGKQLH
jgi:hypothetical protein